MLIAEVILPLPLKSNFDYRIPDAIAEQAEVGKRVLVVFGRQKIYTGVIKKLRHTADPNAAEKLKPVDEILDEVPSIHEAQFKTFEWLAWYYICTEGEVLKAALPTGLKPESTLQVRENTEVKWQDLELNEKEDALLEMLQIKPVMNLPEVSELWGIQNPSTRLKNMASRGLIILEQALKEGYKKKFEKYLELTEEFRIDENLKVAFDALHRAPKQEEVLMLIVAEFFQGNPLAKKAVTKRIEGAAGAIKALVDKGIILEKEVQVDRLEGLAYSENKKDIVFTKEQANALATIRKSFEEEPTKPILLHGVTGSGKTHLYIELIKEYLEKGKQVLYLLPEIGLTKQIIDKVKSEFGEQVGVYHSRFSDHERVEIWNKVTNHEYNIVIGVRSAIFLPFDNLGLIVVDEEHDHSFKQSEPNPRYHARDLAVYSTRLIGVQVLLGSATPSYESYANALAGKYLLVEIKKRAVQAELPKIEIVNMREQRKKKLGQGFFSQPLLQALEATLERGEQAILFQNRRGYSPYLICQNCGTAPKCINCDITLTYHKKRGQLRCHYCGYTDFQTDKCGYCASYDMSQEGVGTERLEEELSELYPHYRIGRMDLDTTRSKHAFRRIINSFEHKEIDVLVGTQMVSKGLDFDNVTLVGVIQADLMLNFPDFRAYERAFQLLTQVSGRAGRSAKKGLVIIQTMVPDNLVLHSLQKEFGEFFQKDLPIRKDLQYPPYTRLIKIEVKHRDVVFLGEEATRLQKLLHPEFGKTMLGPEFPPIARLRNEYRMHFLFKLGKQISVKRVRQVLAEKIDQYYQLAPKKTLRIIVDVDPL
jgi:primosomal protein N' (replication factor Y)